VGAARCDPADTDQLIRLLATVSNHFVYHSWGVRVWLSGAWCTLNPGAMGRQTWMDRLSGWTTIARASGQRDDAEMEIERSFHGLTTMRGGSWNVGISTVEQWLSDSEAKRRDRMAWLLLGSKSRLDSAGLRIVLDPHDDVLAQLQQSWKQLHRGIASLSRTVSRGSIPVDQEASYL
jgi:hypothetical protein